MYLFERRMETEGKRGEIGMEEERRRGGGGGGGGKRERERELVINCPPSRDLSVSHVWNATASVRLSTCVQNI